jgi:tetratricopeptide (TPR) repeat protein
VIPRAPAPPLPASPSKAWFERLQRWVAAVDAHAPGALDAHVLSAASLGQAELMGILADLMALRDRVVRARQRSERGVLDREITYGGRTLAVVEIQRLLGLNDDEALAGDLNRLVKRGAMLHTDVACFDPPSARPTDVSSDRQVVEFEDGRFVGYDQNPIHWDFARRLLDLVKPRASDDEEVRAWYLATGRLMRRQYWFAYSLPHLARARQVFEDDASIQFLSGCLHEALASARVQSFLRSSWPRPSGAQSADKELGRAESFFRRAIEISPVFAEAHLRLGRVLEVRGHYAEAADALRRALEGTFEPAPRYLGALFLGEAEQALGHREAAEAAYSQALGLYPDAQSVHLALSQLARRRGDRAGALAAAERLFALKGDERSRRDPWWDYGNAAWQPHDTLLLDMWGVFREGRRR